MTSSNVFWLNIFFSLGDNDSDISKTHLNKAQEIIKLDFYLRLQNRENFALSALRTSGILFSNAVNAAFVAKSLILGVLASTSVILAL